MWRAEHDGSASSGVTSVPRVPELAGRPACLNVSQHPPANPTPFSTFPTAWSIGSASANDYPSLHARSSATSQAPSTMAPPPSDLLPHGLLATPQPSTPATTLLKVLASRGLTISSGPDATYGNNVPSNGTSGDSPGNSTGGALPPLDSLVLPSPSLLPGGVHSLPTPTSTSSQQPRAHEAYGSRGSPADTGSSKDSTTSPRGEPPVVPKAQTRQSVTISTRRPDQQAQQPPSRNTSGGGVGGGGANFQGRNADGSSTSGHATGVPHMQQALGGYGGAAGGMPAQGHGAHHPGGFQMQSHHGHPNPAAGVGAGIPQAPGSPTVGYTQAPFYMAPMPPGHMMMSLHHHGGSSGGVGAGASVGARSSVGGSGPVGPAREGSAGSGWRGSRSGGGSGGHAAAGGAAVRDSQSGKQPPQYGHGQQQQQQQQMQGPMAVHDGASGPYGMTHMHPGPYAVYGMMTPSIVVPQVLPPVVGSPRGMEAHGPLAHAPSHMGPMVMPHGPPSMAVGMGHMGPMGPLHPFQSHGAIVTGSHMGMHPLAAPHHGGPPGVGGYPHLHHHHHSMGGGYQGNHPAAGQGSGGNGYGQQSYGQGGSMHSHTGFYHGSLRGGLGKAPGAAAGAMQQQQQHGYIGGAKSQLAARGVAGNGGEGAAAGGAMGGAGAAGSSLRDSPLAGRVRAGGREKADKSRAAEQRERKPGNSRAPAAIAQCAADLSALDEQLHNLVRQLTAGEGELAKHQAAFAAVRQLVGPRWPDVKVHLFGSAANGLCIAGANEIDVTLEVPDVAWDDHPAKAAMVSELGELAAGGPAAAKATATATGPSPGNPLAGCGVAQEDATTAAAEAEAGGDAVGSGAPGVEAAAAGGAANVQEDGAAGVGNGGDASNDTRAPTMAAVSALPKARTPVVKLTVLETQTRVDITINNLLALSNTRLLDDYCKVDPRLRQLALLVKHWAKSRGVNDAYRGSLSSYAYVLLCIWLLQQRQPAILPVLQQRQPHTYETTVGPWRCSYNDAVEELADFAAGNKECLAQLLVAFFDHWAWRHDYNGSVVCVRTGGTMAKSAKDWTKRQGNERHLMCIEDPFELSHDLGRTIDKAAVQVLRREFERAARIFASNPDPLPELLAPLTPEEEATIAAALQSRRKASKDKDKEKRAAAAAAAAAAATAGGDGVEPREAYGDAAAATVAGDSRAELNGGSLPLSEPGVLASRGSEEAAQETDEEEAGSADG